jgi:hypothetical protein
MLVVLEIYINLLMIQIIITKKIVQKNSFPFILTHSDRRRGQLLLNLKKDAFFCYF